MNLVPEVLDIALGFKLQLTLSPLNIGTLLALGLCLMVVWRWFKRRS